MKMCFLVELDKYFELHAYYDKNVIYFVFVGV